ncbi:ABC transporter [Hirsutella rhossiliensis]|uniref:ABC transporter domain-containing protein n=1 Tax=Hirsutella rhossiliensis TaxID=111463 RepID=A0A9P8SPN2_9HYPO|nr:ABC transporter domain-containing protein [Hirsutella rhossiliensis]KAH0968391.1 ABC transporter domain-containing protein [Hirsutella rhossiliensis]
MDPAAAPFSAVVPLLYYTYPAAVFLFFLGSSLASVCTLQRLKDDPGAPTQRPGRRSVLGILGTFVLTYLAQLGTLLSWLSEPNRSIGYPLYGSWLLALAFEVAITTFAAVKVDSPWHARYEIAETSFAAARCVLLLLLGAASWRALSARRAPAASDEEHQSLLPKSSGHAGEYNWERREREARQVMEKRLKEGGNWFQYSKGFMILFPYVWPVGNYALQLRAAGVVLCLLGSNALHVLIPRQTGIIMDSLGGSSSANTWLAVVFFAFLRLASSEAGIELVRQRLWIPVKYYAHDSISRAAYSHMMHLSADFHDSKSSSDMMLAIYGGTAVSNVVENILLQAVPMLIDMCVAIMYLSVTFGPYEGLTTVATATIFFMMASRLVAESKAASRKRVHAIYQEHYIRQSGFQGWQTVSSFNQIGYEDNRHADAVTNRWLNEQQYLQSWGVSIAFQTMILTCGLLVSAFLAVSRIRSGHATPGQFAMLIMYWGQLTSPLQFFARLGKSMSDDFIDAERLLDIMKTKPTIENKKGARPLKFVAGKVEFKNVCFTYDGHKGTIKGLNLNIDPGQTVAFVGSTGAGKSTLLKLLDRFYDVTDGSISIDGQDIRDVDLFSLRERIGVVPQNPILFDDTVMNNVRYGRLTASDEEVFEACQAACLHDKIKGFTDGYDTRVGERGVKLSGGELQRVAIARAILKRPDIVLLDEATSAVDTDTEQQIQLSFKSLCKGRTTFIIAHRLSTIMNADQIVVIEHGELVEKGSHLGLLAKQGRYADLWSKQVFLKPRQKSDTMDIIDDRVEAADDSSSEQTAADRYKGGTTDSDSEVFCTEQDRAQGAADTPQQRQEGSKLNPIAPEFTPRALAASNSESEEKSTREQAADASIEEVSGMASEPSPGHLGLSEVSSTRAEVETELTTPLDDAEPASSAKAPASKDKAADDHKDSAQDASPPATRTGQAEGTTGGNHNNAPSDA